MNPKDSKHYTLRLRTLLLILLTAGTLLITAVLVFTYSANVRNRELDALIKLGDAVSGSAVAMVVDFIIEENYAGLDEICLGYAGNPSITTARISDSNGKILADSSASSLGKILPGKYLQKELKDPGAFAVKEFTDSIRFTRAVSFEGTIFGYIQLEISKIYMIEQISQGQRRIMLFGICFFGAGLAVSWFFALLLIRPLEHINSMAENISQGKTYAKASPGRIREIAHLTEAFHRMAGKVSLREQALLTSEKKYREIFENALEGIFQTDAEGKFTHLNPKMATLLGYGTPEELTDDVYGLNDPKLIYRDDARKLFSCLAEQEQLVQYEIRMSCKGGTAITASLNIRTLYDDTGNVNGFEGLLEDITRQKDAAKERLKLKKLESVGVLAGGIAHDFNNILAAILGNISMVSLQGPHNEKIQECLERAEKACIRAKGLTTQLLTFARGGAPIKESTSIADIVRDSADFVLHGSNVSCDYHIAEDLFLVEVDKGQISQVIQNLVINGDHAMDRGGILTICCENYAAHEINEDFRKTAEQYIRLTITDTGTGIPQNILSKVFDPYFTTKEKGGGLGLAVCHSIIAHHDGWISIDSIIGKGTTFTVYLPALKEQSHLPEPLAETVQSGQKARILVMDDEDIVRNIVREMLTMMGHEVVSACDGEEAVALFTEYRDDGRPFDLAILDLTIPGAMGGKEAVLRLLAVDPDARVIVSSGYSSDPVMSNYRDYGFSGSVAKPYQVQDLVRGVESCLRG